MTKAFIIGGGIAGPVTAMALQRVGTDSVVYEAYPENATTGGAFLTVAVNGLDALRTLELHQPVMSLGFPTPQIELVSGSGKRLGVVPIGTNLSDGTTTHTIRRADLYRVLSDEARRRGIRTEHGKRLVAADVLGSGEVMASFEDGTRVTGDLLIGADGIHSRTRRIIDPEAPSPRALGLGNVGGVARTQAVTDRSGAYVMTFGKRAFFGYAVSPDGEIWWFANPPAAPDIGDGDRARMTTEQWKAHLVELFADDSGPAVEIIRSTTDLIATAEQHDLPSVPTWHRGPMIIIGDAAHAASPSSGQGASMAIEDALVLAKCMRDSADPSAAFAAYERVRRPRVERVVAFGARSANSKVAGRVARVARDLMLPFFLKWFASRSQDWLFGHHIEWDDRSRHAMRAA